MSWAGVAQLARASAFQAEGRGFESRFPLQTTTLGCFPLICWVVGSIQDVLVITLSGSAAQVAQLVEYVLGKDEVTGSSPVLGSMMNGCKVFRFFDFSRY